MSTQPMAERRAHPRLPVLGGALFYHPASRRELPGRTANLSRGGLWMLVPPHAPLRAGQRIRFLELPEAKDGPRDEPLALASRDRPLAATVIRVDRSALAATGQVGVAVRFQRPSQG